MQRTNRELNIKFYCEKIKAGKAQQNVAMLVIITIALTLFFNVRFYCFL